MILIRATRRLISSSTGRKGTATLLSGGALPQVGPLGVWYANIVALPFPGRSLVLFTAADTMLSVVAPGRSLRTTVPLFQQRLPLLLLRLGLSEAWVQARVDDLTDVHIARAEARTIDRSVLGTMNDISYQIQARAAALGAFDRLDLDPLEDALAKTLLGALRSDRSPYGYPSDAVAELARA
jgi:hypothetical protein